MTIEEKSGSASIAGKERKSRDQEISPRIDEPKSASGKRPRVYGRVNIDDIAKATLELLRHHSREDITVTMIAQHGRIKRSSIYRYFNGVEEIYRHLSQTYLGKIRPFVEDYVRGRSPRSLDEVVVNVIDAAVAFFDDPHSLDRTVAILLQLNVTSFVTGYHNETVNLFETLWKVDWPVDRGSELHPFRVLAMLITAVFEVSLREHGRITEPYAKETRHVALSYIRNVEQRFNAAGQGGDGLGFEKRIEAAVTTILTATRPQYVKTCVEQLEALARLSSDA